MHNCITRVALVSILSALIVSCAVQEGGVQQAAAASSPQGDTWDSIKQLPDWSGVWVKVRDSLADTMELTPEYAEIRSTALSGHFMTNQATCLPSGATGALQHGVLFEFLYTPGRVTMIFEDGEVRRIYTDGREHQPLDYLTESYMGNSIGHWEGDTLVVDTIGFPYGEIWTLGGVRATIDTHLVERIYLNDEGNIQIDNVMTDPAIFVGPYLYSREYKPSILTIGEAACASGNRDTGEEIDLTPPPL